MGYKDNGTTSTLPDTIPVATGTYNTCVNANTITINSTNNNIWVPITDTNSNIIGEINANGNNLGTVTTSYYLNSGTVRETASHLLYLDRNITITPQTQPGSNVKIRLYITNAELTAIVNAHNSVGNPSQVTGINSLGIFKNSNVCSNSFANATTTKYVATPYTRTTSTGASGYALQASIPSFSTFYFAPSISTLALNLLSFTGQINNNVAQLQWITENENGTKDFAIERSIDGNKFDSIGMVVANGGDGRFTYYYNDATIQLLTCPNVYYRLKIVNEDMQYKYSNVIKLPLSNVTSSISVHPNPTVNTTTVEINAVADDNAKWDLIDNIGAPVLHGSIQLREGNNTFDINMGQLPRGMYYLKVFGNYINQGTKISKL